MKMILMDWRFSSYEMKMTMVINFQWYVLYLIVSLYRVSVKKKCQLCFSDDCYGSSLLSVSMSSTMDMDTMVTSDVYELEYSYKMATPFKLVDIVLIIAVQIQIFDI